MRAGLGAAANFSTRTSIVDVQRGDFLAADLEKFSVLDKGVPLHEVGFNFWGVTFARDGNRFYATLGTRGRTYLVEGDIAAGERLLAGLSSFIWRKYLDYAAVADIEALKRQIHAYRGHEDIAVEGHNIKLGRGGIREIEFFADPAARRWRPAS